MELTLQDVSKDETDPRFLEQARFFLDVRNENQTRLMSGNPAKIAWEAHLAWYREAIRDPRRHLWIIQFQSRDIGTARLDQADDAPAEISLAILPAFRGQGLGVRAIDKACDEAIRLGSRAIIARVKNVNHASLSAFRKAGFVVDDTTTLAGYTLLLKTAASRA